MPGTSPEASRLTRPAGLASRLALRSSFGTAWRELACVSARASPPPPGDSAAARTSWRRYSPLAFNPDQEHSRRIGPICDKARSAPGFGFARRVCGFASAISPKSWRISSPPPPRSPRRSEQILPKHQPVISCILNGRRPDASTRRKRQSKATMGRRVCPPQSTLA